MTIKHPPVVVRGMWGLGDNIYQRAFVKSLQRTREVFLDTPWPELYSDLPNVRFIFAERNLRTQRKNQARQPATLWTKPPLGAREIKVSYGAGLERSSIVEEMARRFGVPPAEFDLPADLGSPAGIPVFPYSKPIAVLRPATLRREWLNSARNPRPDYIAAAAVELKALGFYVVTVADVAPPDEWLEGGLPISDAQFIRGELAMPDLLGFCRKASVLVGGVGWIVPASIALGVPAIVILGGHGGHNAPERILPPRRDHRVSFIIPDRFCKCTNMRHACDKRISDFETKLQIEAARAISSARSPEHTAA